MSVNAYETSVLFLITCMATAAIAGLYLKLFKFTPPAPVLAIQLPILLLTVPIILSRFRAALLGAFASFPFMIFAILALASFAWSENPLLTLSEAIYYLILGTYFVCIAWSYTWQRIISTVWAAMLFISLLSLFLFIVVPSFGKMVDPFPGALMGVMLEKNAAGQLGVFGAILALSRFAITPEKLPSTIFSFIVFTLVLLLSTSKTALMAYLISMSILLWVFTMRRHPAVVCGVIWITVFGGAAIGYLVSNNVDGIFKMIGRNATFTGRAEIWRAVKVSLDDRPWRGHGYSAYWDKDAYSTTLPWVVDELKYYPNHAHNSWLETSLGLGWLGSYTLTALVVVCCTFAMFRIRSSNGAYFFIPFLVAALIIGSFESVLAYPTNFAGAFILLVAAKVMKTPYTAERQRGLRPVMTKFKRLVRPVA